MNIPSVNGDFSASASGFGDDGGGLDVGHLGAAVGANEGSVGLFGFFRGDLVTCGRFTAGVSRAKLSNSQGAQWTEPFGKVAVAGILVGRDGSLHVARVRCASIAGSDAGLGCCHGGLDTTATTGREKKKERNELDTEEGLDCGLIEELTNDRQRQCGQS